MGTSAERPVVLFDSYHAHNFLDRGLIPGEHTYHRITGLRRARELLTDREVEVRELLIGPIKPETLENVRLIVLNLPSMDRPPWLTSEIEAVERFIRGGGGMIFITDHTNCYYHQYHLLPLWQRLGLIPTFETSCERTEKNLLSRRGPGWLLVRNFDKHPVTEGVRYFATQSGGRVVGDGVIARTSQDAWADAGVSPLYGEGSPGLFGDMQYSSAEEQGAQGIILAKDIDRGRVVVISDQNAVGDAMISYADNWRLWLNACEWAGRLHINPEPLAREKVTMLQADKQATAARSETVFDRIVGSEPDRNASPSLPAGSWQVECWEGLEAGQFRWGSTDAEQYYHFWCWLNRWCWVSAHEQASHPAPSGRQLLLASEADLSNPRLRERLASVLRLQGKVVLLCEPSSAAADKEQPEPTSLPSDRLKQILEKFVSKEEAQVCIARTEWQSRPLLHAQFAVRQGTLVLIANTQPLQNSGFTAAETAPDAVQSKWQSNLYHWLFEQP